MIGKRHSPNQLAARLGVHPATVWRWLLHGVRGRRLRSIMIGGRRYVLERDLQDFIAAGDDRHADGDTDRRRKHRQQLAEAQLDARGVKGGRRHG